MSVLRRAVTGFGLGVAGACTLPSSSDYTKNDVAMAAPDGSASSGEAGSPLVNDGGTALSDASDASDAGAIIDLLGNTDDSTFDDGTCGPDTGGFQSQLEFSTVTHSGGGACEVCRVLPPGSDNFIYSLDTGVPVQPMPGQEYRATAWVRRPPGATDSTTVSLSLRSHNGDYVAIEETDSADVALTDMYGVISIVFNVTKDAKQMDVFVQSGPPASDPFACFLIDDLIVWRAE